MTKKNIYIFLALCLFSCSKKSPPTPPAVPVTTYEITPQTIPVSLDFVGVAQSSHLVEIYSRVEGYLWKIDYKEGSFVEPGDLLFEIDPRQFQASVEASKGELDRREATLWAAEQAVKRYLPLYEQKAASKRDLDNATAEQLADQAEVISARARLEKAQLNLSYTTITSPISGLTGRSKYKEGTLITPSINGLLTYVAVVDPIWVIFSVSDYYLLKNRQEIERNELIFPKDNYFQVELILADGSQFPYLGSVDFTAPMLDPDTGTMTVRAVFANPERELLPGQFVRARVLGASRPHAIIIPQQAIQQGDKGMYVYVVDQNQKAEIRFVTTGDWYNNYWFITAGLQKGDRVIVEGVNKVHTGTPIVDTSKKPSATMVVQLP